MSGYSGADDIVWIKEINNVTNQGAKGPNGPIYFARFQQEIVN